MKKNILITSGNDIPMQFISETQFPTASIEEILEQAVVEDLVPAAAFPLEVSDPSLGGDESFHAPSQLPDSRGEIPDAVAQISQAEGSTMALTAPQQRAIELLTSGQTLIASATAAGVSRMTLYRWLNGDAAFIAAFNAWQQDVLNTARGRVLSLSDLAVTTVSKAMQRGDARVAVKVLGSLGILDRPAVGSTDAQEVGRVQTLERAKFQTALSKAEKRAAMDADMAL